MLCRETIAALEADASAAAESHELLDDLEMRVSALTEALEARTASNAALREQVISGKAAIWPRHKRACLRVLAVTDAGGAHRRQCRAARAGVLLGLLWSNKRAERRRRGALGDAAGTWELHNKAPRPSWTDESRLRC